MVYVYTSQIAKVTDVTLLSSHPPGSKFPNVVGIRAPGGKKIVAVYADHSLYTWDVQDVKRVSSIAFTMPMDGCVFFRTCKSIKICLKENGHTS